MKALAAGEIAALAFFCATRTHAVDAGSALATIGHGGAVALPGMHGHIASIEAHTRYLRLSGTMAVQ